MPGFQQVTTTGTTLITLLSVALSACGGDGGTLDRSTDAATDSGRRGRLVITSNGNGNVLQLADDGGELVDAADLGARDGGWVTGVDGNGVPFTMWVDAGADADAGCVLEDCFCFGAFPNVCCRPGGACGCRYMDQECR